MIKFSHVLSFLFVVLLSASSIAQKDFYKEAKSEYDKRAYFGAVTLFKKAYSKSKDNAQKSEILYLIGDSYRNIEQNDQAEEWYQKAIKAGYDDPEVYKHLAEVMRAQSRFDEALSQYKTYNSKNPGDEDGQMALKECELAQKWVDDPTPYKVENIGQLNSRQYDFSPAFMDRRNSEMMFTSTREGATGSDADDITGENFSDIFFSEQDKKGRWSTPQPLPGEVNTDGNEGSAVMNGRKNTMYFTRCAVENKEVKVCNIYTAAKVGTEWGRVERLALDVDSVEVTNIGHPCLSKDDKTLLFVSDMLGGSGGKDIFYSTYDRRAKKWSTPTNLGSTVNTSGNEMFPYLDAQGNLYFASDGHLGMGGLDIFKAEKTGDKKWGKPENMKFPINSPNNDFGIIFLDADKGYFTSDRSNSKGGDDIFSFKMPPVIYAIQGTVKDVETQEPIQGAKVTIVGTDGSTAEAVSDQLGFYQFDKKDDGTRYIMKDVSYTMEVAREKYLRAKGQETTVGITRSTAFVHDFSLQPFSPDKEITFPKVLYPLAKAELLVDDKVNSKDSLNFLFNTLKENPNIVIQLEAHTDSRGSDELNQKLSQRRAETCVNYLASKGIALDRMVPKGKGEHDPYVTGAGIELTEKYILALPTKEERDAAFQLNRRTIFKVIRDDYIPKEEPKPATGEGDGQ